MKKALLLRKGEIDEIRKSITGHVNAISTYFWLARAATESMGFWVENERLAPETVDCDEFFERAISVLSMHFRIDVELLDSIDFEIDSGLQARMHSGTIGNLIINMCTNARRRGGANRVLVRAYEDGDQVKIEISDDGCGVDIAILERIFDDRFSGDNSSGIGLASSRERLQAMGGEIECEPNGGIEGGAKFVISLQNERI